MPNPSASQDKAGRPAQPAPGGDDQQEQGAAQQPRTPTDVRCPCTPQSVAAETSVIDPRAQPDPAGQPAAALDAAGEADGMQEEQAEVADKGRREYVKWTPEEEEIFYITLKMVAGGKPEKCVAEISQKLPSKDYSQVRDYYYRLLKRLNNILGKDRKLDSKNSLQVHQAMVKFWEVFVQNGMKGTCLVGVLKKKCERKLFSSGVQKGVHTIIRRAQRAQQRTSVKKTGAKRKAAGEAGGASGSSAEAGVAPPPAKRRREPPQEAALAAGAGGSRAEGHHPAVLEHLMQTAGAGGSREEEGRLDSASRPTYSQTDNTDGHGRAGSQPPQCGGVEGEAAETSQMTGGAGGAGQQRQLRLPSISSANSFRSSSQGASAAVLGVAGGKVGEKLMVRLLPCDSGMEAAMQRAGYNPFLELTCSSSKSLLSMLRHLSGKWARAVPPQGTQAIFMHPSHDCPLTLRGMKWGGPLCDPQLKIGDIYLALHCPSPFQLLYSWHVAAPSTRPPSAQLAAAVQMAGSQQQQQPPMIMGHLEPSVPLYGSFTQLLNSRSHDPPDPPQQAAEQQQVGVSLAVAPTAPPCQQQQQGHLVPAAAAAPAGAEARVAARPTCTRRAPPADAAAEAASPPELMAGGAAGAPEGPTPSACQPPCSAAEPPTSEARRPRGLLGLLQPTALPSPAGKGPAATSRKPARGVEAGVKRGKKGGTSRRRKQPAQPQQPPVRVAPAPFAPFTLALQGAPFAWQQHPQQQTPPMLEQQREQHPGPPLEPQEQQQRAGAGQWQADAAGLNAHSLLNFLDAPTCAGFPGLSQLCMPGKMDGRGTEDVPALPDSGFALRSWGSLSPPSNFPLSDGFEAALLPRPKDAARLLQQAGAAAGHSSRGGLDLELGPTDFSQLFASMDMEPAAAAMRADSTGATAATAASAGRAASALAGRARSGPTAAARSAVDALFGQVAAGCSGGGADAGAGVLGVAGGTGQAHQHGGDSSLPLLGGRELDQLALSFGSLLGVTDTPSWLQLPGQAAPVAPDATRPGAGSVVGDRPFAALFGK